MTGIQESRDTWDNKYPKYSPVWSWEERTHHRGIDWAQRPQKTPTMKTSDTGQCAGDCMRNMLTTAQGMEAEALTVSSGNQRSPEWRIMCWGRWLWNPNAAASLTWSSHHLFPPSYCHNTRIADPEGLPYPLTVRWSLERLGGMALITKSYLPPQTLTPVRSESFMAQSCTCRSSSLQTTYKSTLTYLILRSVIVTPHSGWFSVLLA